MKTFELSSRRYLGSKAKLIDFIHHVVEKQCPDANSILDLFGGTGIVGYSFNEFHAIYMNDILMSDVVAYETFLDDAAIDSEKLKGILEAYNACTSREENYYSLNFADTYLSKENMLKVGYIRDDIDALYAQKQINKREKAILICSLLYGIDRIANTVGHYDAYRKQGKLDQTLVLLMPNLEQDEFNKNNRIYHEDANALVRKVKADLVYIDPPYNSRQYGDAYHFLENVCLNKKPEVKGVARKMNRDHLKSAYCTSKAVTSFQDLIDHIDAKYILVSHNNTGKKADERSNAKISDHQILEILKTKGQVQLYEQDFVLFNSGKTHIDDHKEQLFLCKVHQMQQSTIDKPMQPGWIKSPLNFTGGKYKLLPQLVEKFPDDIDVFYDIFTGGCNVGINMVAKQIVCIDKNERLIHLLEYLKAQDYYPLIKHLDALIDEFNLSNTMKHGYEFYGAHSSNGVGAYNKEGYLKLRDAYNQSTTKRDDVFFLLIVFGFNNQIRFNSQGEFNLPVGKRDFNASLRKKLEAFMHALKTKNITLACQDFRDIDIDTLAKQKAFLYLDPPYFLGDAAYNENGEWTRKDEADLLEFLLRCDEAGVRFALSNAMEHKGERHELLLDWCLENQFNINYISSSYQNSNYHKKDKVVHTKEVLVTNY